MNSKYMNTLESKVLYALFYYKLDGCYLFWLPIMLSYIISLTYPDSVYTNSFILIHTFNSI